MMEKTYKILKVVLLVLCFVALLLGAARLYDALGSRVQMDTLATQSTRPQEEAPKETAAGATEETAAPQKEAAPDFTVYDAEGNPHKLSDFQGKPVILNFWATWCGYCKQEMPDFETKFQEYGDQIHFLILNVTDGSRETLETASDYVAQEGYTFPVYYDTGLEATMAYNASSLPVTYFIDSQGNFVAWQRGMLNAEVLQQGIDLLLAE